MSKNIVKVIFDDKSELSVDTFMSLDDMKLKYKDKPDWIAKHNYESQFRNLERDLLHEMNDSIIEDYAKDQLYLIDEDDCDCADEKDICDFEDSEILSEAMHRKIISIKTDIVNMSFFYRTMKVLDVVDHSELNLFLCEMEKKYLS